MSVDLTPPPTYVPSRVQLVGMNELCDVVGVSDTTVLRWIAAYPDFPALRVGSRGAWRFDIDTVLAWMQRQ